MGPRKNDQQTRAHCGSSPAGRYDNFFHDSKGRLIRRMHKGDKLTDKSMTPFDVFQMIKLRAKAAALPYSTCCHTFRAYRHHHLSAERRDARARPDYRPGRPSFM